MKPKSKNRNFMFNLILCISNNFLQETLKNDFIKMDKI